MHYSAGWRGSYVSTSGSVDVYLDWQGTLGAGMAVLTGDHFRAGLNLLEDNNS